VSYILAIESDPRQAAALSHVVKDRVPGAQLTVVDSKDGALASIQKKAPDLILLTALFSPREEEELITHLRTLEGAEHLQTLTIPLLAASDFDDGTSKRGLFGFKKKKRKAEEVPTQGCDPVVFAEQIAGYLKTAAEMKANAEAAKIAAERAARRAAETAAETPSEPVVEPVVEPAYQPIETMAEAPAAPVFTPAAEPAVAEAPQPMVAYEAEPIGAPDPEPPIAPAPEPTPAAEPRTFGSVLFAKVRPKREIKPFTEAPPAQEDAPLRGVPVVDELPIVPDAPAIVAQPIEAPPSVEPLRVDVPAQMEPPRVEVPVAAAPIEEVPAYARVPEPPVIVDVPRAIEPLAPISVPRPAAPPEPARPVRLVQRLPPLAMWARRLQEGEAIRIGDNGHSSNGNDEGPLGVLRIPPAIATISYPTGCRIRRVIAKSA
jgi:CheY-like chemotaxis protein